MRPYRDGAIWLCLLIGLAGCSSWEPSAPHNESLLKPITMADDGLQLEVISARFAVGDADFNGELWNNSRRAAVAAGAAARSGGKRPALACCRANYRRSSPENLPPRRTQPATVTEAAARLEHSAPVSRQKMQLHSGWRGEIVASGVYADLPLMMLEHGRLAGASYPQAQGIIDAQVQALGDHRIKLHLTPELQYGVAQQQFIVEDGVLRPQTAKPKRTFERLAFDTALAQDQMLLVTCLPDHPGTLGYDFFTEQKDGQPQQKLVVIRLAESRYSDLFVPPSAGEVKATAKSTSIK